MCTIVAMADDPATLQEVTTQLDGLRLFYRELAVPPPDGAPAIVHVHGFGISGTYLLPTASRLAPFYQTYVPDLPGFGRSQHPAHHLGIPALADAVARFMDHVKLDKATLLGNSLGCPITAAFVAQHRDRIERAILVSPAGGPHNRPIVKGVGQLALAGLREPLGMAPIAIKDYLHYGIPQTWSLFRSMIAFPTVQRFLGATIPVLVVLGDRDPLVSEERIRFGVGQLPQASLVSIDGAAHAINFSHPDQLANVVHAFMEGEAIVDEPSYPGRVRVIPPLSTDDPRDVAERESSPASRPACWPRIGARSWPRPSRAAGRGRSTGRSWPTSAVKASRSSCSTAWPDRHAGGGATRRRSSARSRSMPSTCPASGPRSGKLASCSMRPPPS